MLYKLTYYADIDYQECMGVCLAVSVINKQLFIHFSVRQVLFQHDLVFPLKGFPSAAEQVGRADEERHQTGQGVAVPESPDAPVQDHAQQEAQADAGEDAVQQRHRQVQLRVAGAVDQREVRRPQHAA